MKYVYPAVFSYEEEQYLVSAPDLPGCHTFGKTLPEAIEMARDAMAMWLCIAEDNKESLPVPDLNVLKNSNSEKIITLIYIDTLAYRKSTSTKAVKKTLSIPERLNDMAVNANINFSNVLQNALMEQLNI